MLLKIAAAGLVASMIGQRIHGGQLFAASICTVAVVSSRSAWEPTPLLLETNPFLRSQSSFGSDKARQGMIVG